MHRYTVYLTWRTHHFTQATALNRFVEDDSIDGHNTDFNADFDADFDLPAITTSSGATATGTTAAPVLLLRLNSNGSQAAPPHIIDDVSATAITSVIYAMCTSSSDMLVSALMCC
jgi:hypothetical protein